MIKPVRTIYFLTILFLGVTVVTGEYKFESWTTRDGLPQNSVRAITRTRDGYLWMGTFEGLASFDGVDFITFDASNTPEFKINFPSSLVEDGRGSLWIGFYLGGLVRHTNGRFFHYSTGDGLLSDQVWCIAEGGSGNILVGTEKGLNILVDDRVVGAVTAADGLPSSDVRAILDDGSGGFFIGTARGLSHWSNGTFTNYSTANGLSTDVITTLARTSDGALWIGTERGLDRFAGGKFMAVSLTGAVKPAITKLLGSDDLWIGTQQNGLYRISPDSIDGELAFTAPGNNWISAIYKDPDNALWVGSINGGLHRYRKERFRVIARSNGLIDDNVSAVIEDRNGALIFSTDKALFRSADGVLSEIIKTGPGGSVAENEDGLWVETPDGLVVLNANERRIITDDSGSPINRIRSVLAASDRTVWVGTWMGAYLIKEGRFVKKFTTEQGLSSDIINAIFEDSKGAIWFGTLNGITRLENGRFTTFDGSDGLPDDILNSFLEDSDGAIWIGTNGKGLVRYKDGQFRTVTSSNGLFNNLAFVIVNDFRGNLWFCGNKGIYRASLDQLNDFLDGKRPSIDSYSYDTEDGLLHRECNQGSPTGFRRRNGELMFATVAGLAIVDPAALDPRAPIVNIERMQIAGELRQMTDLLEISPGEENVEIKYTGISWARPTQIRFKYKLEGLNNDWIDAGNRRTAYFSYIPPGDYTFRVIADNGEGIWSEEGKSVRIKVWPPFYRSLWFNVLSVAVFAMIVFLLYRRRIARLEGRRHAQQAFSRQLLSSQEQERKRIAAELHDSLGQRLVVIKNLALMYLNGTDDSEPDTEKIEAISAEASHAIGEVKEISYNLRPYQLDRIGLTKAVEAIVRSARSASDIDFSPHIDNIDNFFPKDLEINFYRIVQECVSNTIKHSQATTATVRIERTDETIALEIKDNGIGFTPFHTESKTGGFGLTGMVERVELFGGKMDVRSSPGHGTEVSILLKKQS